MAISLYYRDYIGNGENDNSSALHFCNLIVSDYNNNNNNNIQYYEARKIRGLIHKKLRNYKAACHDFEFICYNNPINHSFTDKLYLNNGKSNFLENKIISSKKSNINNYYPGIPPIVFIPPINIMDRNNNNDTKQLLNVNYSDLTLTNEPKGYFPQRSTSNTSFEGLIALAHAASTEYDKKRCNIKKIKEKEKIILNADDLLKDLNGFTDMKRKTTREELLGEQFINTNISSLHKTISITPEPLERIRSDALVRNYSQ
eukprot:397451_1